MDCGFVFESCCPSAVFPSYLRRGEGFQKSDDNEPGIGHDLLKVLARYAKDGSAISSALLSCTLMFKQEIQWMYPVDADVQLVKKRHMWDPFEHLMARKRDGLLKTVFTQPLGTISRQIQEKLRIEKIFEEKDIDQEIEAYALLMPDGNNRKATMLIEYADINERKRELARLIAVEDRTFVDVEGHARVCAIADEDMDRDNEEKTSAVHFVRLS